MTAVAIQWDRPQQPNTLGHFGGFADTIAARIGRVAQGASESDLVPESPNSLQNQLATLRARGFRRINDPRQRPPGVR